MPHSRSLKERFARGWQMVELRLESVTAAQQDAAARLGLLDRQMSALVRDVRDLRGGVTRQLTAQDAELAAMKGQLVAQDAELVGIRGQLRAQDAKLTGMEGQLAGLSTKLDQVLNRLPKL